MSMAERKTMTRAVKNPVKRKLTRAEKKEIAAVIQAAKGDGKPHTAQQTIPYLQMYPDGICRVTEKKYSKSLVFEDINYQLAQADDKTAIFENWCDFLNYFDASVSVQLSFINQGARKEKAQAAIEIPAQDDAFNSIRREYADMLKNQLEKGNNGLEKCKYITFSIEADNLAAAKARLSRIETDVLNNFKVLGVTARPMNGQERLNVLHGIFHPEGEPFRFSWDWLVPSGLSTKDFIAPSSFRFGEGRYFRMGRKIGAVSFLEILAPELNDRMLADILDLETGIVVNLHIKSIDQTEAIKTIKRKITDLDKMKIEEQKKAVRSGYDMDIIPSDLAMFGGEAKNLLQDLQSRNERMFLLTFLVVNMADTKRKLENDIFAAAGIAQKYNCALTRLDYQQETGLMSSVPLGENLIPIQRGLTTYLGGSPDPQYGAFLRFEVQPNAPEALRDILQEEQRSREQLSPGDFKAHIAALRDGLIEAEARRIVADMKRQYSPNSPNKTHYMTELAPAFMMLASSRDVDRLFSLLPYKTLTFSKIEGRHGIYALIDKNENRDRDIRKPRPSIRAQLAANKKKAAPKRAAKTKHHEMEV